MRIIIGKSMGSATIDFAEKELASYLKRIDKILTAEETVVTGKRADNMIYVGLLSEETTLDDRIMISVKDGAGYISGSNERSVLIAVYKFLENLGCKWFRPGPDGEFIPQKNLTAADLTMEYDYTPPYRHRGVCIEGGVTYQSVYNMINWLPKVGLNEYFVQFHNPWVFFDNWKMYHDELCPDTITKEETALMTKRLEEEISLRGLGYHKVGHGWTYPLVGKEGSGWCKYDGVVPDDVKDLLAEINGKRDLWEENLFNTNLCYSNPVARDKFTNGIVEYCKKNPQVNYLHFWLADAINNHCECEECRKKIPSDFYVMMLNELDEKLTAEGLDTKIVFLLYLDLMFPPETETIKNPDRFTLMYAKGRKYNKTMVESLAAAEKLPEMKYERNKVDFGDNGALCVNFLKKWQKVFGGDSFSFDYHMMWHYQIDPGSYRNAYVMHEDMKNLANLKLNGEVSCQLQRVWVPVNLTLYGMAKALWDNTSEFSDVVKEYFEGTFDKDGMKVAEYLKTLSDLYDTEDTDKCKKIIAEIDCMAPVIEKNLSEAEPGSPYEMSWKYVLYHGRFTRIAHEGLDLKLNGDRNGAAAKSQECQKYVKEIEPEIQDGIDAFEYIRITLVHGKNVGLGLIND